MRNTLKALAVLGVALGALGSNPAHADSYKFTLNNTSQYEITGFQTYEDEKWSTWSGVNVPPGGSQIMDWQSSAGACTVPFRIIYKDVETEQYSVNWCKISNIWVTDTKVTAD
jgi:hypothetical protein